MNRKCKLLLLLKDISNEKNLLRFELEIVSSIFQYCYSQAPLCNNLNVPQGLVIKNKKKQTKILRANYFQLEEHKLTALL